MAVRRRVGPIVAGAAVVAALVYAFVPRPVEVDTATIDRRSLIVTVDEEGHTRVIERYVIAAPVAGGLDRIDLKAGAVVSAGAVIARIRPSAPTPLDARTAAQWRAREQGAEAALQQARARVEQARAALDFAAEERERRRAVVAAGAGAKKELDQAETEWRSADAELRAAESAVRVAAYARDEARAVLAASTAAPGAVVPVRAPRDGVVLRVFEESARVVAPGTPLVEIGDPARLEVIVDLLSTDAVKVRPGARVLLERWGGDAPLEGRVRLIEPSSFTKISALGVEEQRVNVLIDFTSPRDAWTRLGDRFAVETRIVVAERPAALVVPTSALFRQGEGFAVFVVDSGRAVLRSVDVGLRNGLEAEVLSGLEEGSRVVVFPGDAVADGAAVEVRSEK